MCQGKYDCTLDTDSHSECKFSFIINFFDYQLLIFNENLNNQKLKIKVLNKNKCKESLEINLISNSLFLSFHFLMGSLFHPIPSPLCPEYFKRIRSEKEKEGSYGIRRTREGEMGIYRVNGVPIPALLPYFFKCCKRPSYLCYCLRIARVTFSVWKHDRR